MEKKVLEPAKLVEGSGYEEFDVKASARSSRKVVRGKNK
jgi:hypothetical protein